MSDQTQTFVDAGPGGASSSSAISLPEDIPTAGTTANVAVDQPPKAKKPKGEKVPPRPYIILEETTYDDGTVAYVQVGPVVTANNTHAALRIAFKQLCVEDPARTSARLVAVAQRSFKATGLVIEHKQTVSVSD